MTRNQRSLRDTQPLPIYRPVASSLDRASAVAQVMQEAESKGHRLTDDEIDG